MYAEERNYHIYIHVYTKTNTSLSAWKKNDIFAYLIRLVIYPVYSLTDLHVDWDILQNAIMNNYNSG